jgi:hypothetical protein
MLARLPLHSPDEGLSPPARRLLLGIVEDYLNVSARDVMACLLRCEGIETIAELDSKIRRSGRAWRPRPETAPDGAKLAYAVATFAELREWSEATTQLLALPAEEFLAAIEHALQQLDREDRVFDASEAIAHLFRVRLLPYAIDQNGVITWCGEPGVHELAISPALAALTDSRLATARAEFEQARRELLIGELDDAANDAGCAVETTMAVLLNAYGHRQPQRHGNERVQAGPLFDALKAAGLLDHERDRHLVFAAIDVRDAASHGAGVNPRPLDPAYVDAGLAAAAAAITYLASKLP